MPEPFTDATSSAADLTPAIPPSTSNNAPDAATNAETAPSATSEWRPALNRESFTIVREHAQGGLGRVVLARDEKLERLVAIKEIRHDRRGHGQLRQRFLAEARITGQLEHPGIVPIYAMGEGPDGEPFYVMRFIAGRTFAEAFAQFHSDPAPHGSSTRAATVEFRDLLQRFVAVCNTIAYAHSKGVIHRDLKPANIMLGEFGETLVLDWGLAKRVLNAESPVLTPEVGTEAESTHGAEDSGLTEAGQILGTPAYMAPEQATGAAVGPAADIWALGAILCESLTGRPPFRGASADVLAILRNPEPVQPEAWPRALPRALEAICLKALAWKPQDRYRHAGDLAADVNRYLADEPVSVCPEPWVERSRRWTRRHRTLVTAVGAVLIVGLVLLGGATVALNAKNVQLTETNDELSKANERESQARQRTEKSYQLARASLSEAMKLQADPRFQKGLLQDVRIHLQRAEAMFYQRFVALKGDDEAFHREQAQAFRRLGTLTAVLGVAEEAVTHDRRALELYRALLREHPDNAEYQRDVALALFNLAEKLDYTGRLAEAEEAYRESAALQSELLIREPQNTTIAVSLIQTHRGLGALLNRTGRDEPAAAEFANAARLAERLVQSHPHEPEFREALALVHFNQGHAYQVGMRFEAAEKSYLRAKELLEALTRSHPETLEYRYELAKIANTLGTVLTEQKRYADAEPLFLEAFHLLDVLATEYPLITQYQLEAVAVTVHLGVVTQFTGRSSEAEGWLKRALPAAEKLAREQPTVSDSVISLATVQIAHGNFAMAQGAFPAAQEWQTRAVNLLETLLVREPRHTLARQHLAIVLSTRGTVQLFSSRPAAALRDFERSAEMNNGRPLAGSLIHRRMTQAALRRQLNDLARNGKHAEAATEARRFTEAKTAGADTLFTMSGVLAVAAEVAKEDSALAEGYASEAMNLLRRAHAAGFFRTPAHHKLLHEDKDLDALRSRQDFKQLCSEAP
jgi:serine/threonine-protein kinase